VLATLLGRFPRLQLLWADGAYTGILIAWVLDIIQRPKGVKRFVLLAHRGIVEWTFCPCSTKVDATINRMVHKRTVNHEIARVLFLSSSRFLYKLFQNQIDAP
jgi:hypothetical protein